MDSGMPMWAASVVPSTLKKAMGSQRAPDSTTPLPLPLHRWAGQGRYSTRSFALAPLPIHR
ncbi:hypothetical protein SAMN06296416_101362 [Pseudoxanthomonas wuyuanensis]|uniref:Uncharacterized protein n=1 Tax=Pseudoxanthomonas wuyuanensis TaxID=1073196 RepID=A0A286CWV9_9GAMM|nr:hypothetical protein SAMN06296416_101362 [Pseudoxanthomonas wuyuanensis]